MRSADMIKVVAINSLKNGSPARIMEWILDSVKEELPIDVSTFYGKWKETAMDSNFFGLKSEVLLSGFLSKLTGIHGIWNILGTHKLIKRLAAISPDIIHLHNIHMWNINIPMLFAFIKKNNIRIVWTLHDCWAFTGQCPYFSAADCNKWRNGCGKCKQLKRYPGSIIDNTKLVYNLKRKWFLGVDNLIIVTPSQWLLKLVNQSFLKEYDAICINNGIDISTFSPRHSDFRKKYGLENKRVILGVAFEWGYRKGLDIFTKLSRILDSRYVIVLIGYNGQLHIENLITIGRTNNQIELAEIYSAADVFLNPTREDNFPTVNIEALACGTPVVTFDNGGSKEMIDETCGIVLADEDVETIKSTIDELIDSNKIKAQACRNKALEYDYKKKFKEYAEVYKRILGGYDEP